MNLNKKSRGFLLQGFLLVALLSSCTPENKTISLTEQYGPAYAPVTAARLRGWFEEELPGVDFKWQTAGNAAAYESLLDSIDM